MKNIKYIFLFLIISFSSLAAARDYQAYYSVRVTCPYISNNPNSKSGEFSYEFWTYENTDINKEANKALEDYKYRFKNNSCFIKELVKLNDNQ